MSLLKVDGLRIAFGDAAPVVDGVSFALDPGRSLGLVGASGSGKSLTALALLGLLPRGAVRRGGRIDFGGEDPAGMDAAGLGRLRGGGAGLVFQEPFTALNPLMRVGAQIEESLRLHRGLDAAQAPAEAAAWLERVGILPGAERARQYPHQYSGGMRQRALLAMALAGNPRLLICDEPTTALDATVQAQVLALIRRLQAELGFALLIISHDLSVIHALADRALVLEAGKVVEEGSVEGIVGNPQSGAARRLVAAESALSAAFQGRQA
jgi:ABC-type glutathione transport system ATPase component